MNNEQIVFSKIPDGMPQDGTFKYEDTDVIEPSENELQLRTLYISVDPYMRGHMTNVDSYVDPFKQEEPFSGHTVSEVLKPKDSSFDEGDIVVGMLPWRKISIVNSEYVNKVSTSDVPLHFYLSVSGMPGQTVCRGLLDIGQPKEGETVVISTTSGAVGSVVGQIAKLKGCRVVGITGGDKKVNYLKNELRFDVGVDHKKDNFPKALKEAVPSGVDVYFENVGGYIGDEVLRHLSTHARIPACNATSSYNHPEKNIGPHIQQTLIKSQAMMRDFIVAEFVDGSKEASKQLAQWVQENKVKAQASVEDGFDKVPQALRNLLTDDNFNRQVIRVANE